MTRRHLWISLLAVAALLGGASVLLLGGTLPTSQAQDDDGFTYEGRAQAPSFPEGIDWLNTTQSLTWDMLQGKIVLLDFWTYGCINCIHTLPDFARLEAEFGDSLVVIGVHSAKFDNEGSTQNIRQIVQRYGIHHPVVNDDEFVVWQTYGVQAWPTQVLIDPNGKVVGGRSGEGVYEAFQPILATMTHEYGAAGLLNDQPIAAIAPEQPARSEIVLNYPGKVLADVAGNRLIISDTANHRLLITDLDTYNNTRIIGTGQAGFADGAFAEAQFNSPQGLALDGDVLYVADTGNHAIRQVLLDEGLVTTLVGTGQQADSYPPQSGTAPAVALSSPWDVTLHDGVLYVAMAGSHQLWRVDLTSGDVQPHAGSGRENIIDGALAQAQLAQPSGITTDGSTLYFADAEASGIRTASLATDGTVETIVGTGLFDFGDVDGTGDEVRLQHPLGVTVGPDGALYVADTYNNKIKVIDPTTRSSRTLVGDTEPGTTDGALGDARFYEPGGLHYADGVLYVADTNNHAIRVIDLETGTVETVQFQDRTALVVDSPAASEGDTTLSDPNTDFTFGDEDVVQFDTVSVAPGTGHVVLDVRMPEGYKLNDAAPFTAITSGDETVVVEAEHQNYREILPELPVRLPVTFEAGQTTFSTELTIYWCEAVNYTLCFVERVTFEVPVTVEDGAEASEVVLTHELVPPQLN